MTAKIIDFVTVIQSRRSVGTVVAPIEPTKEQQYVPAYCDPKNETRGARFDRGLNITEIAKRVRQDIVEAKRAGTIPRAVKVSVRADRFAGGCALRVKVVAVPAGFEIANPEHVAFEIRNPHASFRGAPPYQTAEATALLDTITGIAQAYNRDNSDAMSDYFDVHFYDGRAEFSSDLTRRSRDEVRTSMSSAMASES